MSTLGAVLDEIEENQIGEISHALQGDNNQYDNALATRENLSTHDNLHSKRTKT